MISSLKYSGGPRRRLRGGTSLLGLAAAALPVLLMAAGPPALAQVPNRVFADCVLNENGNGPNGIDTLAGLTADILATNTNNPNDIDLASASIAYVVIYAIDNDNNGQEIEDGGAPTGTFTGPVICVAPGVTIDPALQTDGIPNVDILDLQDALILRHAAAGSETPGANRFCHTTDGSTDCFDIE